MNKFPVVVLIVLLFFSYLYSLDLKYIKEKAKEGSSKYQIILGIYYYRGENVKKNPKKAFKWFMKAANQNIPEAQFYIGSMYRYGYGIKKNLKKSVEWLKKSADKDYARAQYILAGMYYIGLGEKKNNIMAYYYYKLAEYNKIKDATLMITEIKETMTQTEINNGKDMFRNWTQKNQKKDISK